MLITLGVFLAVYPSKHKIDKVKIDKRFIYQKDDNDELIAYPKDSFIIKHI